METHHMIQPCLSDISFFSKIVLENTHNIKDRFNMCDQICENGSYNSLTKFD